MGIDVRWEDENGNPLGSPVLDSRNLLAHALTRTIDPDWKCVQFIDRYGDTLFNHLQMATLVNELESLRQQLSEDNERQHLDHVIDLLKRPQEPHAYVRFIGD